MITHERILAAMSLFCPHEMDIPMSKNETKRNVSFDSPNRLKTNQNFPPRQTPPKSLSEKWQQIAQDTRHVHRSARRRQTRWEKKPKKKNTTEPRPQKQKITLGMSAPDMYVR